MRDEALTWRWGPVVTTEPSVRVLLLIHSIRSTTWGHEAWPQIRPILRRALEMRQQIARDGWWT
jgi:hypothetical protein